MVIIRVRVLNCYSNRGTAFALLCVITAVTIRVLLSKLWSVVCSTELRNHSMCGFWEVLLT